MNKAVDLDLQLARHTPSDREIASIPQRCRPGTPPSPTGDRRELRRLGRRIPGRLPPPRRRRSLTLGAVRQAGFNPATRHPLRRNMALTQTQLADAVAERADLTRADAKRALTALEEVVLEEIQNAEKVKVGNLVQLTVRLKP